MADVLQIDLSKEQEKALLTYASTAQQLLINQFSLRSNLERIDRDYMRENDWTPENIRARMANRSGNNSKIQDVTVPIIMPQVESALAYYANVFLTGYPIFGVASDPINEDAALQMETIIAENAITAGWAKQLAMFFRDGLKYNLHALECEWVEKNVYTIETNLAYPNSAEPKQTLWKGNVLKRMDLYNTFFDPRVHPTEIHEHGEFAGYIEIMSRVRMKKYFNDMFGKIPVQTVLRALQSSPAAGTATSSMAPFWYYQPLINPFPAMDRNNLMGFNWLDWANNALSKPQGIQYNNVYQITKLYARIIPRDFGLKVPSENTPQVWKFIIVNGNVIVVAERQTNAHNFIPMFFGQPNEDGLDYQTKSFASNVSDMQNIATGLMAGYIASKRRLIGDRVIYDPLRIREKDINSQNPAAKIPVRPSAYGKNVSESVYAFPYRDEQTHSLLEGVEKITQYANLINGQNPAKQGQFVPGNKTLEEYKDTMGHSNDTNQLMALMTENQVFTPIKEVIKLNILQFQPATTIFNRDKQQQVQVKPEDLRKAAVNFKVSDGELPQDKLMSTEEMQAVLQAFAQTPQLAQGYNVPPLFTYLLKIKSNLDISPFEKSQLQTTFEQQQGQWEQVAQAAIKAGQPVPPQPQMPPELVQELKQKQQTGGVNPSPQTQALQSTQGS